MAQFSLSHAMYLVISTSIIFIHFQSLDYLSLNHSLVRRGRRWSGINLERGVRRVDSIPFYESPIESKDGNNV